MPMPDYSNTNQGQVGAPAKMDTPQMPGAVPPTINPRDLQRYPVAESHKGLPFYEEQYTGGPYRPGAQPQSAARGGTPAYYLPPNQLYPLQIRPINNNSDWVTNQKEMYKQLIPTSINLRNYSLQNLLQQQQLPMEQLFAAQGTGAVAGATSQAQDQLRASMAGRGMSSSGAMQEGQLTNEMAYLKGVGAAGLQSRAQEDERQRQLLQQLLSVPEADLRFYQAIRSGAIPAGNLFAPQLYGWGQAAQGITELVKSVATSGAGGGGGAGMAMGASGYMGGGGGFSFGGGGAGAGAGAGAGG